MSDWPKQRARSVVLTWVTTNFPKLVPGCQSTATAWALGSGETMVPPITSQAYTEPAVKLVS